MNTVTTKISALAFGFVFAIAAITAPTANAGALEDQIAALLAQIAALQAQINGGTTTATTGGTTAVTKTYVYTRLLKVGKRGDDVKALQTCLNRLGNNTGVVDGIFGPNTKAGVKSFQAANGLVVDGIIGPQTGPKFEAACAITTTTGGGTDDNTVTGDKLVISGLASDDMIVGTNQTVVFAKLTLEAGDEDVKAKKINVKYDGSAPANYISDVVLLDSAMLEIDTDGLDSSDEATLRADVMIDAGETTVLYLAARTAGTFANDGLEGSLKVASVTTDGADVEGTPIMGATHTFNSGVAVDTFKATLSVDETGSVKIGEEMINAATVNVENNSTSDDTQTVKSLKLTRVGTASDDALDNVKIKVNGKTYKASQDNDEYTFDFGDGVDLDENGDDEDFVVYVDIEDDSTRTFAFYLSDIVVVDVDGVILSENDTTDTADPTDLDGDSNTAEANGVYDVWEDTGLATIDLSDVVISKTTDVQSEKVAAGDEANLASFEVEVTGKDVEGDVEVTIVVSNVDVENGDGVANSPVVVDPSDVDLDNVAIFEKDGSRISDREDTSFSITPGDGTDDQMTYVVTFDNVTFEEGEDPVDYVITGTIGTDVPDGTRYEVTQIKYTNVKDVDGENLSDITETIASPAQIDVEAAVIAVSVEAADDTDLNTDKDDQEVAQIKLDASNSGDNIKVTKVKLAFAATAAGDRDGDGDTDADDNAFILSKLRSCELFDGSDSVSNREDAGASVTFNLKSGEDNYLVVTKDSEKDLSVRCDLGSTFGNGDIVTVTGMSFDAEGKNTGASLDATFTSSATATVTTGSTVFKLSTADSNDDKVVKDDANDVVLADYEFKAKDAELTIDDVTVTFTSNVSTYINGKVDIYINGEKEDSVNATNVNPSVAAFTNLSKTVAKDETVTITIKADMDTAAAGNSLQINTTSVTTEEGVSAADPGATESTVTVVAALPIVTKVDVDTDNLETADDVDVFAYKVKADGGDIVLGNVVFDVTASNVSLANTKVKVFDNASKSGSAELEIDASALTGTGQFDADLSTVTVANGDTYYVFLIADTTTTNDTRVLRAKVSDATYVANTTGMTFTDVDDSTAGNQGLDASLIIEDDMKSLLKKD